MAPINWALKNEEGVTGSPSKVTERVDAGPVLDQLYYPIDPERDEVIDVYERALQWGWALMNRALPRLDDFSLNPKMRRQPPTTPARISKRWVSVAGSRAQVLCP